MTDETQGGKRILVTGMSGLIGGMVGRSLAKKNYVRALNRQDVEGVDCVQADISDLDAIRPAFEGIEWDEQDTYSSMTRSVKPTITPAIGPSNGISEIINDNEDPNIAAISEGQSWSTDITIEITCTSLRKPSGNKGRIGRSIRRLVKVAFSEGRPSRLMKPPGILPTA